MLNSSEKPTSDVPQTRQQKIEELTERLHQQMRENASAMAEALVDLAEDEILGDIELTLRDQAQDIANKAHQQYLNNQKKTDTMDPRASAPSVKAMPTSADTDQEPS